MQQVRTQIYLPKELREEIDKQRKQRGVSLAGYLREAAKEKVEKDKKRKADLKKIAEEVIGSVKKSAWDGINVEKWQHDLRKSEDEHRFGK